jgi:hypothetical protein
MPGMSNKKKEGTALILVTWAAQDFNVIVLLTKVVMITSLQKLNSY